VTYVHIYPLLIPLFAPRAFARIPIHKKELVAATSQFFDAPKDFVNKIYEPQYYGQSWPLNV
jgi:hypothetical protein